MLENLVEELLVTKFLSGKPASGERTSLKPTFGEPTSGKLIFKRLIFEEPTSWKLISGKQKESIVINLSRPNIGRQHTVMRRWRVENRYLPPHHRIPIRTEFYYVPFGHVTTLFADLRYQGISAVLGKGRCDRFPSINARAETVSDKPACRTAFRARRCVVRRMAGSNGNAPREASSSGFRLWRTARRYRLRHCGSAGTKEKVVWRFLWNHGNPATK